MTSREAYNRINSLIEEHDFSEQGWLLVSEITTFYETDADVKYIDRDTIKDIIIRKFPKASKIINTVIDNLEDVSVSNATQDYIELKKEALQHTIAEKMLSNEDYADLLEKLLTVDVMEQHEENTIFIGTDIYEILSATSPDNLIRVHPLSLNNRLDGGLVPGSQIAIYAPTEVGKSLFSINMCCGFLKDGRRVLYGGNEDPSKSMLLRMYNNLTGMTKEEIRSNPNQARQAAIQNGYNQLVFKELTPGSLREVRSLIEKYKPEVVIIDQMANMECRSSSKVEKNEILACGLRTLAKKYGVVMIILHQASDDAYGKNILQKNHMYYSNVGVQGQMDVMIGIGMDASYEQQDLRMLCLTKNKLSGNHENFPVRIIPSLSRVED